jgi:hypothetical protein
MLAQVILSLRLIQLTGPDNQAIEINPEQIVALREPRDVAREHIHKHVNCLIFTADGKFIGVTQNCAEVRDQLNDAAAPP